MGTKIVRVGMLAVFLAGCATLGTGAPSPEERLERGIDALQAGDLVTANIELRWLWENHWDQPIGKQALLVLAAAELDPRNPARRTDAAATMATLVLDMADTPTWMVPIAQTMYLLSLELGVNDDLITNLVAQRDNLHGLPTLPGANVQDRIDALRSERDSLAARARTLEQTVTARDRTIQEKDQELERIRRTLTGGGRGGRGGGGA